MIFRVDTVIEKVVVVTMAPYIAYPLLIGPAGS